MLFIWTCVYFLYVRFELTETTNSGYSGKMKISQKYGSQKNRLAVAFEKCF